MQDIKRDCFILQEKHITFNISNYYDICVDGQFSKTYHNALWDVLRPL